MTDSVQRVLDVAREEIGYLEKSAAAVREYGVAILQERIRGAGRDNYTKYGYEMHQLAPTVMDYPAAWCDAFVDWCFYKALGREAAEKALRGRFDDYTKNSASLYTKADALIRRGARTPEPGWQIFFSRDQTFSGIYHTGLVEDVRDGRVITIEGNTSNDLDVVPNGGAVCRKSYALDNVRIYGYGIPDYPSWHWVQVGDAWYYQDAEGRNVYGWQLIKESAGEACHWYFFDTTGRMLTGLQQMPTGLCYLSESGPLQGALMTTDSQGYLHVWDA
jgi:hypothetical protein